MMDWSLSCGRPSNLRRMIPPEDLRADGARDGAMRRGIDDSVDDGASNSDDGK